MAELITVQALEARPTGKDVWLNEKTDERGTGRFCARITEAGTRTFYFRYTGPDGKQARYRIGTYDPQGKKGFTLKAARSEFAALSKLYKEGVTDIKGHFESKRRLEAAKTAAETTRLEAETRQAESRLTVSQYFEQWANDELTKRKDGGKEAARMMNKDVIHAIGSRYLEEITKADIRQITKAIQKRGANVLAREIFTLMRQMFQSAVDDEVIEINPTASLNKRKLVGTGTERDRVLSDEEIKLLSKQIPESGLLPTAKAATWICLATLCRIGELLNAEWQHIDFRHKTWRIPAENAKNGRALDIFLSDFALEQFRIIQQYHHDTPWLFPNRGKDGPICSKTITKQIGDRQRSEPLRNRSQHANALMLPGGKWTPHDLRRTGSTVMASMGIRPEVIDRCQNHKEENRIRRVYQRYSYQLEMNEAWQLLGERLEALTGERLTAQVIPLWSNVGGKS